ncbi:MAG: alpha/beta hydrolase [Phycisphaerae bacterium]
MRAIGLAMILAVGLPAVAGEMRVSRDVAYADPKTERQTLDVYAGEGARGRPDVWIHSGGWQAGDKKDVGHKPRAFVDRGYVLVSVNYRLLKDGVTIGEMAQDVAAALRWVHDHVADHGGDPKAICVTGHSAGAQLAALVCTDDRYFKGVKLDLTFVRASVPVDGDTYDVPMQIATVEERRAGIYRKKFGVEASRRERSAVTHAAKGKDIPPFLILHVAGHAETRAQSDRLAVVLRDAGVSSVALPIEGKTHVTLNADLGQPDDKATAAMFEFFAEATGR